MFLDYLVVAFAVCASLFALLYLIRFIRATVHGFSSTSAGLTVIAIVTVTVPLAIWLWSDAISRFF